MLLPGLALLAALVYLPALLQAGYLNFDDNLFFGPDNQAFVEGGLAAVFDPRRTIANVYLPVAHASLWLDWTLFGNSPLLPHVESLLLHVLAAHVLVRWLQDLGLRPLPALASGVLFLLHPALVESVAWVSSRKDVLAGLFALLCLRSVTAYCRAPSVPRLVGIAALGLLAMYSKATAIVLPGLAALTCLYAGGSRRRYLTVAVLAAVAIPVGWHHRLLALQEGTLVAGDLGSRLLQVPGALWHYVATAFWPADLNVLYPEVDTMAAFRELLLPAAAALALLVALSLWLWRRPRGRAVAFGIGWFLIALLPFNTAFPAANVAAADRYLYLAVPGAALALASVFRGGWLLAFGAAVPLAVLAGQRAEAFSSSERLWRSSLAANPHNAVAELNLAYDLQSRGGETAEVRELFERAAADARYPIHALRAQQGLLQIAMLQARYQAAALHAEAAVQAAERLGDDPAAKAVLLQSLLQAFQPLVLADRPEDAAARFAQAKALAPDDPTVAAFQAMLWLADARGEDRSPAEGDARAARARELLDRVLREHPGHYEANLAKAQWEEALGHNLAALRHARAAQQARPEAGDAWLLAATICQNQGLYREAERYARDGLRHRRDDPALRQALAMALAGQMRFDDAIDHMQAYVDNRPRDRDAARILAHLLGSKARAGLNQLPPDELERLVQRARELDPEETKGDFVLGFVARQRRDWLRALHHLERAAEAHPDDPEIRAMLAETWRDRGYQLKLQENNPQAAFDCWRRFLDLAPPGMPTEVVEMFLENEWKRQEQKGVEAVRAGDSAAAEKAFRRCLELRPDLHWAAWLLGQVLYHRPGAGPAELEEAEALFARAAEGQERHGLDAGKQVLHRILTLLRLQRVEEAEKVGRGYLQAAGAGVDPAIAEAIRKAIGG